MENDAKELECKLYINTHFSIQQIEEHIKDVCKVFDIKFGKDIILHEK